MSAFFNYLNSNFKESLEISKSEEEEPITIKLSDKINEIPPPDKLDQTKKPLIIFDDCINNINQEVMNSYYSRSRHNSCNCIYLHKVFFN